MVMFVLWLVVGARAGLTVAGADCRGQVSHPSPPAACTALLIRNIFHFLALMLGPGGSQHLNISITPSHPIISASVGRPNSGSRIPQSQ